jgi:hypothetical protein
VRTASAPGLLFFPHFPQVAVVLQQLPDHLSPRLLQELFQLEGRQGGRGRAGELAGQRVEHCFSTRRTDHQAGLRSTLPWGFFFLGSGSG